MQTDIEKENLIVIKLANIIHASQNAQCIPDNKDFVLLQIRSIQKSIEEIVEEIL